MRRYVLPIVLIVCASPAAAQSDLGDIAAGRRLAETWCAECHRVSPTGPGPATDSAPAFAAVASMTSTTPLALRVFLQTPHRNMPNFQLSREQTDDVIAYTMSLRTR